MKKNFKGLFLLLVTLLICSSIYSYHTYKQLVESNSIVEQLSIQIDEQQTQIEELEDAKEHYRIALEETNEKLKTCQSDLAKKN